MIILAAGQGTRLRPYTNEIPKCMVAFHGKPLLHWQLDAIRMNGINDIVIVGGYKYGKIIAPGTKVIFNPEFATSNMVQSLWYAKDYFGNGFIMCYGDIVYNPEVFTKLLASTGEISVVVDKAWKCYWKQRTDNVLNDAESLSLDRLGKIGSIGQKADNIDNIEGQYIGMVAFRKSGIKKMQQLIRNEKRANLNGKSLLCPGKSFKQLYMTDLLQGMINEGVSVDPIWIGGGWLEIDTANDLLLGESMTTVKNNHLCIGW